MIEEKDKTALQRGNPWFALCIVVLLAAGVRTWIAANTYLISTDSAVFLRSAELLKNGNVNDALSMNFHPLYPAVMAGLSLLSGLDLETCGVIVSIALGSLTVLPLYFITRELFNPLAGILAGLVLAFHAYSADQSADIMSEGMYIFLLMCGAWALLCGMRRNSLVYMTTCGLCSGLAYLVRPEGVGLIIAMTAYVILCRAAKIGAERRAAGIIMAVVACALVAAPYVIHLGKQKDGFDIPLTQKKSVLELLGIRKQRPAGEEFLSDIEAREKSLKKQLYGHEEEARPKYAQLFELAKEFVKTISFFGLAFIVGVAALLARRERTWGNTWLLFILALYGAVLLLLYLNIYRAQTPSQRHILPLVTVCMVWAGYGLERLVVWFRGALARRASPAAATALPVIALLALFVGAEIYLLKPRRENQLGMKYMGEVLGSQGIASPVIMTSDEKIAYYAGGRLVPLPPVDGARVTADGLFEYAKIIGVDFIVVSMEDCNLGAGHSLKFLEPGNHDPRFELLPRRADEAAVRERYGVNVGLKERERFVAYRIKR